MFKKVVLGVVAAVLCLVAVVMSRPSTFRVERSLVMAAPAELPFGLVNTFQQWHYWSPWDAMDPKMQKTFDGPIAGPGASYSWSGNDQVGKGKMTILDAKLYERIDLKLEFTEPWQATNATVFKFEPVAEGTKVTWSMEGNNTFMGKAFSLFMDMDGMIGKDFEKGLASMKGLVEPEAKKRAEMEAKRKADEEAAAKAAAEAAAQQAPAAPEAPKAADAATP
jgi:hypothetical protein